MVLNLRCSVFQYVMYIKRFLCPNSHVHVTIIHFLVFYLPTLIFASLHIGVGTRRRTCEYGALVEWYRREEPCTRKGKSPFNRQSFIVYSVSEQVTGYNRWKPMKWQYFTRIDWSAYIAMREGKCKAYWLLYAPYDINRNFIFLAQRVISMCFVWLSNNKCLFSWVALTHWSL
jgi:hypothetical protein